MDEETRLQTRYFMLCYVLLTIRTQSCRSDGATGTEPPVKAIKPACLENSSAVAGGGGDNVVEAASRQVAGAGRLCLHPMRHVMHLSWLLLPRQATPSQVSAALFSCFCAI